MSQLKVRKIDFAFSDDIPFQSCPGNPYWGNFVNLISLIGPGFERYFIRAIREAMPRIRDARVRADAELFCQQEAQHARAHLAHLKVLTSRYPGLEETSREVTASYERLLASKPLEFHLAYAATVELAFGPSAKFMINHRDQLFAGGDARIASFILWHLVEEFEHRNAAYDVFRDVVGSYFYRLRTAPLVAMHLAEVYRITERGLEQHVPRQDCIVAPARTSLEMFRHIPLSQQLNYLYEVACTFLPFHKPDNLQQPPWVTQWFADEAAGKDMSVYYSPPAAAS
jgi:predicted metal-dependent hydrolase